MKLYKTKSGKEILIGRQSILSGTVCVWENDIPVYATMFIDDTGDIFFIFEGEYIYFRSL
jgi:hypothetical protein